MNGNQKVCSEIRELLVDYADAELSGADAVRVREHVDCCGKCQQDLRQLEASRVALQRYWEQLQPTVMPARSEHRKRAKGRRFAAGAAAAAAVLVIGTTLLWTSWWGPSRNTAKSVTTDRRAAESVPADAVSSPQSEPGDSVVAARLDVLALIDRETQVARLRATLDILETQPGLTEEVEKIRQQLASEYDVASERALGAPN